MTRDKKGDCIRLRDSVKRPVVIDFQPYYAPNFNEEISENGNKTRKKKDFKLVVG